MLLSLTASTAADAYDGPFIKQEPCHNEAVQEPLYSLPWVSNGAPNSLESSLPFVDLTYDGAMGIVADAFTYAASRPHASLHDEQERLQDAYILSSLLSSSPSVSSTMTGMESPVSASDLREFHSRRRTAPFTKPPTYPSMVALLSPASSPLSLLLSPDSPASEHCTTLEKTCNVHSCKEPARSASGRCVKHGNTRRCVVEGCTKNSQSNGKCIRHGGGKRCEVEGCPRGAQARGKCKSHGGGVRCKAPNCFRSSQGSGLCRTHGGGKLCDSPGCKKGTQRHGKCSTHGGARRCRVEGCEKVDRGGGFCGRHKAELGMKNKGNHST